MITPSITKRYNVWSRNSFNKAMTIPGCCYVYMWLDGDLPIYVGKGNGGRAWSMKNRNPHLTRTVEKMRRDGKPVRVMLAADELSEQDAFAIEKALIATFGRRDLGTGCLLNMTDGGEGPSGYKPSPETREKIRAARAKQVFSEESIKKRAQSMRETWAKKKPLIAAKNEQKRANRVLKGPPKSKETREKMAQARREWWAKRKQGGVVCQ